eukprot:TCALIF_07565-PA protein Name:"Protein of unknown function" AED:0.71 eAED:0.71 QI:0/0/0.16/0.16/0.8/1/6/0/412
MRINLQIVLLVNHIVDTKVAHHKRDFLALPFFHNPNEMNPLVPKKSTKRDSVVGDSPSHEQVDREASDCGARVRVPNPLDPVTEESDSASADPRVMATAAQATTGAIAKTEVSILKYSGHSKDTEYKSENGTRTEIWEVRKWIDRCEHIKGAARWTGGVLLQQAILCLVSGTPADDFYQCKAATLLTWEAFKNALIKEFSPPLAASERFIRNIEDYNAPRDALANNQDYLSGVKDGANGAVQFFMDNFFLLGLRDRLMEEVTLSGASTMEEMIRGSRNCVYHLPIVYESEQIVLSEEYISRALSGPITTLNGSFPDNAFEYCESINCYMVVHEETTNSTYFMANPSQLSLQESGITFGPSDKRYTFYFEPRCEPMEPQARQTVDGDETACDYGKATKGSMELVSRPDECIAY